MNDIYYWDSCVFLSYINGTPSRLPIIDDLFSRARKTPPEFTIVTSVVSISEVAFAITEKQRIHLDEDMEGNIDSLWRDRKAIRLAEDHELIQRGARQLIRTAVSNGWALKPMDAIHLATARSIKATQFHTYDLKLQKFAAQIAMPINPPDSEQGVLQMLPEDAIAAEPCGMIRLVVD